MFDMVFRILATIVKRIGDSREFCDDNFIYSYKNKLGQLDIVLFSYLREIKFVTKNNLSIDIYRPTC
jgi:hypothetical protein